MKMNAVFTLGWLVCDAALTLWAAAQTDNGVPHLREQGAATQLIVDGKPFLALAGELTNNAATSLPMMEPIWPKLIDENLNTALVGVSWAQFEPEEGTFNYIQIDGVIAGARENHMHLVILWFASWKNGTSSFAPYWVKKDYTRFPRIQIGDGSSVSISGPVELLSTFGDVTRDADAAAFGALMRHIREVDGAQHTVLMMQVENEVGVLRDSRDRSPAANRAFAGPVPAGLMKYLEAHKDTLIPEFRAVWAANGYRSSGTWEEVFGPGKPADLKIPIQTTSPPMSADEHEVSWRELHWPSDEIFMAWNYARYVEKVVQAGKTGYDIPMYVNGWLQQPNHAWPGTYPSGGPMPQVHDIWRAGAPDVDILAPDLYLPYFDEVCQRFSRNGNPLFIPETGTDAANVIMAVGKYNAIGFSPFGIDGGRPIPPDLAATYEMLNELAPIILAHQGNDTMTAVRMVQGDPPRQVRLGNYTLTFAYTGSIRGLPPQAKGGVVASPPPRQSGAQPGEPLPPLEAAAVVISTGPDEYYFGGGGMRVDFTPNTPGPSNVGLGVVQQGRFVDGKWELTRWIEGDDDAQGEILMLHPATIDRVQLYRFP
ncbi:MAG: DUF5597 domain-containing protein [Acidobacteriaceae bacterium]|jgi:hypothetical protein